jgi:hypothetical protein
MYENSQQRADRMLREDRQIRRQKPRIVPTPVVNHADPIHDTYCRCRTCKPAHPADVGRLRRVGRWIAKAWRAYAAVAHKPMSDDVWDNISL